jgi:branched-chain amino acid transport system substrate-binding protein
VNSERHASIAVRCVALALSLVSSLALADKKYGPGATDTEIKLGQSYPYSGPLSAYSTIAKAQGAYFKKVNEEGGVNGRRITLISLDDGFSPPKTVENVRRLVEQDEVLALFNVLGTPTNTAILKYVHQKRVPNLFVATGASKFGDHQNNPWTIGWQPTYHVETGVFAHYIIKNLPNAKVAVLYQNDDAGRDFLAGVHDGFGDLRSKVIVAEVSYEVSDPTVDSQVLSLQGSGADVFLLLAAPKATAQAIRKAGGIGWKPTIFISQISSSVDLVLKPAGLENAVGIWSTAYIKDPSDGSFKSDKGVQEYLAFMKAHYPDANPVDPFNVYGYTTAQTMLEVLKRCGDDLTRENLMRQATNLKDLELPMLTPGIRVNTSPTDYFPIEQEQMMRFDGQKWIRIGEIISGR